MLPSLGQWIARPGEVPKGKFLKGISSSPGGLRTVAMAARGGWLWPVPSPPGAPGREGVGGWGGEQLSRRRGRATSLTSGNSGGSSSSYWTPAVTLVALNLWLICVTWQWRSTGNSLGISGRCSIESWLSHWTVKTFWTNCLTSLLLFSFSFFHLQMKIPIS